LELSGVVTELLVQAFQNASPFLPNSIGIDTGAGLVQGQNSDLQSPASEAVALRGYGELD
jgi:hypothetical protein